MVPQQIAEGQKGALRQDHYSKLTRSLVVARGMHTAHAAHDWAEGNGKCSGWHAGALKIPAHGVLNSQHGLQGLSPMVLQVAAAMPLGSEV